jgi:chloramphenicol O-acetyltransferase type B
MKVTKMTRNLRNIINNIFLKIRNLSAENGNDAVVSEDSILGKSVDVGHRARVISSVIFDEVTIGQETIIENSTLEHNINLANNSYIYSSKLENNIRIYDHSELIEVEVGSFSYISINARISQTRIGRFCSIGPELLCGLGRHPVDFISTSPVFFSTAKQCGTTFVERNQFAEEADTFIGHDVWIGARVYIKDGVRIGNGAIVGAGAVVVKDVPDYAIVGGVPAKLIRYRFKPDVIEKLLEIKWWNWDVTKIKNAKALFSQPHVELFLEQFGHGSIEENENFKTE